MSQYQKRAGGVTPSALTLQLRLENAQRLALAESAVVALPAALLVDHAGMAAFRAHIAYLVDIHPGWGNIIQIVISILIRVTAVAIGQGGQRCVAVAVMLGSRFQIFPDHQRYTVWQRTDPVGAKPAAAATAS